MGIFSKKQKITWNLLIPSVAAALKQPAQLSGALADEGRQWSQAVLPFPAG